MKDALTVFEECSKTSSNNEKIKILTENNSHFLRDVLDATLNTYITYGVKKYNFTEPANLNKPIEKDFEKAFNLLARLSTRELTGNRALEEITKVSGALTKRQQELLSIILDRDLKCGVSIKTINKVFKTKGGDFIKTFNVMLAIPFNEKKIKQYPVICEPKLDGVRCLAMVNGKSVSYFSRNGKEFNNFEIFSDEIVSLLKDFGSYMLDGEVIGNKEKSFKGVMQQVRRKKDVNVSTLTYNVFDIVSANSFINKLKTKDWKERNHSLLQSIFMSEGSENRKTTNVRLVKGKYCFNFEDVEEYYKTCLNNGWEGIVIKDPNADYEYKRSSNWIKLKPTESLDLKIVAVEKGNGKYKDTLGALVVKHKGKEVNVGTGLTDDDRKELWKMAKEEKLIGKIVEVGFDSITEDNSLRFPRFIKLRPDLDKNKEK
jgi:DNA ligase-1